MKPSPSHFVIRTQPNAEQRVVERLRRDSYEPYYPRVKLRVSHARRADWAFRPFLPRYLFVRDDQRGVSGIKRMDGVSDVVRMGFDPVRVRQDVIDKIKAREIEGFVQLDGLLPKKFRPGQLVRVVEGQYQGRDAIFQEMSGTTRAVIFLAAVIGRVSTEIPVFALETAAA